MRRQNAVRMAWIYCGNVLMGIVPIQPRQSVEQAVRREQQFRGCDSFEIVGPDYRVQQRGQLSVGLV